jgi:hypothetical protein
MPMVSMKTKKPMLEMLAITDEAGLSSPNASERPRRAGQAIRSTAAARGWSQRRTSRRPYPRLRSNPVRPSGLRDQQQKHERHNADQPHGADRQRESSGPRLVQCTIGVDEDRRQAGPR